LVAIHGHLDPLINLDMEPATHAKVKISHKDDNVREEVISLYQTVAQFKTQLNLWFNVPTQNMKLWYCDQVMVNLAGPEEMKWSQKALYTYNVQEGDKFILDEKVSPTKFRANVGSSVLSSSIPKVYGSPSPGNYRTAVQFGLMNNMSRPGQLPRGSPAARNLFGGKTPEGPGNKS
jgi:hypothetical protein